MMFHRILLLNRNHIGDCLFTTPTIRALRRAYPEASLVAAVPPANQDLLASNPCLSEVLVRPLGGVTQQIRLLREIRRRQFDLVISFQEKSLFYATLARLSGAAFTVSLRHWRTQSFYRRVVPVVPDHHEVEKYYAIARPVLGLAGTGRSARARGGKGAGPSPGSHTPLHPDAPSPPRSIANPPQLPGVMELHVSHEHQASAAALLADLRVEDQALLIGINPGATLGSKRWPGDRFAAVGRALAARYGARILVLGGNEDAVRAAAIARAIPGAVSVAGRARLGETAALLHRCRLVLSGDTGPLHMAVAMAVPAIGLFGPTNPRKYGPWGGQPDGVRRAIVLRHSEPCLQCSRPCIHTISPDECLSAAAVWLEGEDTPSLDTSVETPLVGSRETSGARRASAAREAWDNA